MTQYTISKPAIAQLNRDRTDRQIAEQATIQSFLNCYLRETNTSERVEIAAPTTDAAITEVLARTGAKSLIRCTLDRQGIQIFIGLQYWSSTGRHLFSFPVYYQPASGCLLELDYVTLVALIAKELALASGSNGHQDELLLRVIQSCGNIEEFVRQRKQGTDRLYAFNSSFIETEQALVFGHHLHPTPKSRQGFSDRELFAYSPELKGRFQLHYFRAHNAIVQAGSGLPQTATALIKSELLGDSQVDADFKQAYCGEDEYTLLPVHPWQANFLQHQPNVQKLLHQGMLQNLGLVGRTYQPTSSIRTVYHPEAKFMLKLSLNVKITNSVRTNLYKELERSIEVHHLLSGEIGKELRQHFPNFNIIRDPAYVTLKIDGEPDDRFSTILRENPFLANPATDVTCLIALCQDSILDNGSRLSQIICQLARQERRSTDEVSVEWFRRYLNVFLEPILWLYFTYGIGIEAHQQNSVLQLQDGYPYRFFYRDNQGYYYRRSCSHQLNKILPGIGQKSQTICDDAVVDERLGYYLFVNNLFGMINAFGVAGLVDERSLLAQLHAALSNYALAQDSSMLSLLSQPQLRCKANLLTRFHDMDELVGSVSTQSVYVAIDNPLYVDTPVKNGGIYGS